MGTCCRERKISLSLVTPIISFSFPILGYLKLTSTLRSNLALTIKSATGMQLMLPLDKFHIWKSGAPTGFLHHISSSSYFPPSFCALPSQPVSPALCFSLGHLVKLERNFTNKVIQIGVLVMQQCANSRKTVF